MVVTGDITQIDLANPKHSGLIHAITWKSNNDFKRGFHLCKLVIGRYNALY
jgi:phosphate starvation-inducible protein PhoH